MTKVDSILSAVKEEYQSAASRYPRMRSAHEGFAILREEVDELWDEIKHNDATRSHTHMKREAVQVAAMAVRFLHDVIHEEVEGR